MTPGPELLPPPSALAVAEARRPLARPAAIARRPDPVRPAPPAAPVPPPVETARREPARLPAPATVSPAPSRTAPRDEIDEIVLLERAPGDDDDEVIETPARRAPPNASVTAAATEKAAIDLSAMSLIGIYGTAGARRALVRLPSGAYKRITRGDRIEGWQVAAIGADSVRLARGGELRTLKLPGR